MGDLKNELKFEREVLKPVRSRYVLVFLSIFLVTTLAQAIIQFYILQEQDNSTSINVAGRQRMLSQRLLKQIYNFHNSREDLSPSDTEVAKLEIDYLADTIKNSHYDLINGNQEKHLPQPFNKEIKAELEKLSSLIDRLSKFSKCSHKDCEENISLAQLDELSNDYLTLMNNLVYKMDQVAHKRMKRLSQIEIALYLLIIGFMAFEIFKVILPANRMLYESSLRNIQKDNLIKQSEKIGSLGSFEYYPITGEMFWTDGLFEIFSLERAHTQQLNLNFLLYLFHKEDREKLSEQINQAIEKGLRVANEYIITDSLELERTIKLTILREEIDETTLRIIGLAQDITTQKAMQAELDQERSMAHQNVRMEMVSRLAGGVSHEINNPIAIISGLLRQAKILLAKLESGEGDSQKSSEQLLERLDRIESASQRITKTIKGLKSFSSFDQGKVEEFDAVDAVSEAVSLNFPCFRVNEKWGLIQNRIDGQIKLKGERHRFQEVIINLLSNARAAVESDENKEISIHLENDEHSLRVTVRDEGRGISEENLPRIFDPFFTTKDVNEGSGLGLSLAYTIAKEMNGRIEVQSVEGRGSEFTVILPYQQHIVVPKEDKKAA